jgi:hypothetical protein
MFIRHKTTSDGRRYYYIVETIQAREGKSRQQVVKYLGTVEKILSVFEKYGVEKNGNT